MKLRIGYELIYDFPQATPVILVVNVHDSRAADIIVRDDLVTEPHTPIARYHDSFGNLCHRILAPAGRLRLTTDGVINDSGRPEEIGWAAYQDAVQDIPEDKLQFLLGSRYCETDLLSESAWQLFSHTPPGHARVQAICDFVHRHIMFDYQRARATRSANEAFLTACSRRRARIGLGLCPGPVASLAPRPGRAASHRTPTGNGL